MKKLLLFSLMLINSTSFLQAAHLLTQARTALTRGSIHAGHAAVITRSYRAKNINRVKPVPVINESEKYPCSTIAEIKELTKASQPYSFSQLDEARQRLKTKIELGLEIRAMKENSFSDVRSKKSLESSLDVLGKKIDKKFNLATNLVFASLAAIHLTHQPIIYVPMLFSGISFFYSMEKDQRQKTEIVNYLTQLNNRNNRKIALTRQRTNNYFSKYF